MNFEKKFRFNGQEKFKIKEWKTDETFGVAEEGSKQALKKDIKKLKVLQDKLYASDNHGVLIIFQAMDAAGKDGTIKHVMSGINPQGCQVSSFKSPTANELDHDYLWRINAKLPERGRIGIFNRSYYEEVLVTKVHPEYVVAQKIPEIDSVKKVNQKFWEQRYEQISNYEKYLTQNGYTIIKFFLHLSKEEQKNRFLSRIDIKEKNWKFSAADIKEREHWNEYQKAFEEAIQKTSTEENPWYVIPADNKWFTRLAVSKILINRFEEMNPEYPTVSKQQVEELQKIKQILLNENEEKSEKKG